MDNAVIMQCSNSLQRASENVLHRLQRQIYFGRQVEEIVREEFVYIHQVGGYRVLWQAEMRTIVDLAIYLAQVRKVRDILQYILLIPTAARNKGEPHRVIGRELESRS